MPFVKGDKIQFKYESETRDLLVDATFRIDRSSRIGLIGKNGSGKSTLMRIILGELRPVFGQLQVAPDLRIGHLKQVQPTDESLLVSDYIWNVDPGLHEIKRRLSRSEADPTNQDWDLFATYEDAGGYAFEILIQKKLAEVGLDEAFLYRPMRDLSGGEKTKIGLLRILVNDPHILLLDEPTNNLDIEGIRWLKAFLDSVKLPFLLVSHDRLLLEECTTETWELENGRLAVFSGNYGFFQNMKERKYVSDLAQYELQQKKIEQLQVAAASRRIDANKMENFKESRSIKKNGGLCKRDEGSGSRMADPTKKMRAAKAVESRIHGMIEREEAKKPYIEKRRKITLPVRSPCSGKVVLSVKNLALIYATKTVFSGLDLTLEKGQRLAVVGPNGSGKTSLLKTLTGEVERSGGELRWTSSATLSVFCQDSTDLLNEQSILQSVWQPEFVEEDVVRTVLGSLGIGADLINKEIRQLSPGEKVKTALGKTVLSGANVLILDEPTNHLEVQAREMLERALIEYEGSVIVVSHDMAFIEAVSTRVFDMSLGQRFSSFEDWKSQH